MKLSQSVYSYHYQQSLSQGLLLYAEIAVFFPSGSRNHRQYSLRLFTGGGQAELAWVAGYIATWFARRLLPLPLLRRRNVEQR